MWLFLKLVQCELSGRRISGIQHYSVSTYHRSGYPKNLLSGTALLRRKYEWLQRVKVKRSIQHLGAWSSKSGETSWLNIFIEWSETHWWIKLMKDEPNSLLEAYRREDFFLSFTSDGFPQVLAHIFNIFKGRNILSFFLHSKNTSHSND